METKCGEVPHTELRPTHTLEPSKASPPNDLTYIPYTSTGVDPQKPTQRAEPPPSPLSPLSADRSFDNSTADGRSPSAGGRRPRRRTAESTAQRHSDAPRHGLPTVDELGRTGREVVQSAAVDPADALLAWYDAHRRDLPWRASRDPYRVWVSEVMLQQTRVETVLPFYRDFLARFPDRRGPGRRRGRRGARRVVGPRLLPAGPPAPCRRPPGGGGRRLSADAGRPAGAARDRRLHRGGGRLDRLRDRRAGASTATSSGCSPAGSPWPRTPGRAPAAPPCSPPAAPSSTRRPPRRQQPGDDGAGRDGLHAAPAPVSGLPAGGRLRGGRRGRSGALSAAPPAPGQRAPAPGRGGGGAPRRGCSSSAGPTTASCSPAPGSCPGARPRRTATRRRRRRPPWRPPTAAAGG